jgi:hypothetical protein
LKINRILPTNRFTDWEIIVETKSLLLVLLLFLSVLAYADRDVEIVFVDTVYWELNLSNTMMYNMQTGAYNGGSSSSFSIGYGRSPWGDPGVREARAFMTFQTKPVPDECVLYRAELQSYCCRYSDNGEESIWPHYYDTPYPVIVDHMQFTALTPDVFYQTPLAANVAVLQDSAYIGWVGTDVTESYSDDFQQARTYTQYRFRFPPGYDVYGYAVDWVDYVRGDGYPRLILSYTQPVSNSDPVTPVQTELIKQIYPLPARDVVNIELTDKDIDQLKVSLYDLKGRLIHSEANRQLSNGMARLDIPVCPSGMYILKVEDRSRKQIRKITVIR